MFTGWVAPVALVTPLATMGWQAVPGAQASSGWTDDAIGRQLLSRQPARSIRLLSAL